MDIKEYLKDLGNVEFKIKRSHIDAKHRAKALNSIGLKYDSKDVIYGSYSPYGIGAEKNLVRYTLTHPEAMNRLFDIDGWEMNNECKFVKIQ